MTIEQRVVVLERSNRRLKALWFATLISGFAVLCLAADSDDKPKGVVKAKGFAVVDDKGTPCGTFGVDKSGSVILTLHHATQDKAAVVIAAQQTGGAIRLSPVGSDETDRRGVYLFASGDAGCTIAINGPDGNAKFSAP